MNMKDVVPQALANGAEGVKSALADLRQKAGEYQAASNNACDTYFAGVTERENAVRQRLADLRGQLKSITARIEAMGPTLAKSTIAGDNIVLAQIQSDMTDLEAQKAAVSTQIELLLSTQFPQDAELYDSAAAYRNVEATVLKKINEARQALCTYAQEQAAIWQSVYEEAACSIDTDTKRRFEAVQNDFNSKETIQERLSRRDKEAAKQAAHEAALARQKAMLEEMEREEEERRQREAANRPEYKTVQAPGVTIRYRLNHETDEYEEVARQSNVV